MEIKTLFAQCVSRFESCSAHNDQLLINKNMNEIIRLEQVPVINHDLLRIGKMVDERIEVLNLDNLVATEDTVKAMKTLRAELNKEFKEFEEQRKTIKTHVSKPYDDMEAVYKEMVTAKYTAAVNTLKAKITEFEEYVKKQKELEVEIYFDELCEAEGVTFLKFEQAGIKVGLSNSMKSLKEEAVAFVERVKSDIELIETQEHKAEIYVEYHKDLNASRAIKEVSDRKAAEKAAAERLRQAELDRRKRVLLYECNTMFDDFTQSYAEVSEKLYEVPLQFMESATPEEFESRITEIKRIRANRDALREAERVAKAGLEAPATVDAPTVVQEQPVAPVQQEQPQLLVARFAVQGTRPQLEALRDYLINNNLKYKNI